ncbi:phosphoribosyltransferase [Candidatus Micrarchaeota archaeon]|nr:phosphoribosyltransferase [Candidatus Micrarchaeota archaeon]
MEYLRFSWEETERAVWSICKKIQEVSFKPDTIVAISRGGLVPAKLFSDALDVRDLRVIRLSFYEAMGKRMDEPRLVDPLPGSIEGKRVLLVDDISDSGESFRAAMAHLLARNPASLKTASIHMKEGSPFKPDFFFQTNTKWVVYPWEKQEFTRDTGEKLVGQ